MVNNASIDWYFPWPEQALYAVASVFISPEFRKRFEDPLGKELYVAVPDRFNVFVFPKFSDSIEKIAPKMTYLYKEALYPVSREVFEISAEGIRVIGKF